MCLLLRKSRKEKKTYTRALLQTTLHVCFEGGGGGRRKGGKEAKRVSDERAKKDQSAGGEEEGFATEYLE